jgi:hypothetical protein
MVIERVHQIAIPPPKYPNGWVCCNCQVPDMRPGAFKIPTSLTMLEVGQVFGFVSGKKDYDPVFYVFEGFEKFKCQHQHHKKLKSGEDDGSKASLEVRHID